METNKCVVHIAIHLTHLKQKLDAHQRHILRKKKQQQQQNNINNNKTRTRTAPKAIGIQEHRWPFFGLPITYYHLQNFNYKIRHIHKHIHTY